MAKWRYEIWQDGMVVAEVSAEDQERAWAEAMHYAAQYGQDGPVLIKGTEEVED